MIRAWFTRLARRPGVLGDKLGRRGTLVVLVALTALALPLAVWGWGWVGSALAPSPVSHASPLPASPPPPRPPERTPTFSTDLGRDSAPASAAAARALPELAAAGRMPDPFEGAADDTVSLKLLERKLRIKEAELKLAQLERQIREMRDGAGPAPAARPSGLAGLPSAPPSLRGLPPVPPLGERPAPRQAAPPPASPAPASLPAPAPASPPAPAPPAPAWPVVRLVSLGAEPFALVEIGGDLAQVRRGDQLGDVVVERVDLNGVGFRHLPTDQRRFALVSGAPSATPGKTP